jgi:predicted DNA-binding WGR domain protein
MRRFEFSDGKSNKFWEIALEGNTFTVTFGRIGTSGQTQTKTFDTAAKAEAEHDKLVKEKTKKGYVETESSAPARAPAPASASASASASAPAPASASASASASAPAPAPASASASASAPAPAPAPRSSVRAGLDWSAQALREAAPRRGSDIVKNRKPDPKGAYAKLAATMKRAASAIDAGRKVDGANAELATRAQAAYAHPAPAAPLDVQVEAAAFALVAGKLDWSDTPREEAFVDHWCAVEGPAFALRALAAVDRTHTVAQGAGHSYELAQLALVGEERSGLWWRGRDYTAWRALRRAVVDLPDAERTKLMTAAKALATEAASLPPRSAAGFHATLALAFEERSFVEADVAVDQRPPVWQHARALLAGSATDALAALDNGTSHAVWYTLQSLDPIRWDFLHAFGADAGAALAPLAKQAAVGGVDRMRSIAETMADVVSDEVAEFFLAHLASKELRAIASDYLRAHPPVATARLAEAATRKGPHADAARAVLKAIVAANDPSIAESRAALGPAANALLDALVADAAPKVEAEPAALPPVLRDPPFAKKRPSRAQAKVDLVVPTWDEKIVWDEDDRARVAKHGREPNADGTARALQSIERANADPAARSKASYQRTAASVFLDLPAAKLAEVLPTANLSHFNWSWYGAADALLARHGMLVVEPFVRFGEDEPTVVIEALAHVDSPRVAPLMADAFNRLKSQRDTSGRWLTSFAGAATVGLLPLALGKEKRKQANAEAALRFASKTKRAEMLAAAERCGAGARAALEEILDFDPLWALPSKIPALPSFWSAGAFSRPLLHGRERAVPLAAVDAIGTSLALSTLDEPYTGITQIKEACDPRSLADFAWDLFQAWLVAGAPAKEAWAFQALGHFGDDECARRLTPLVRVWPGEAAHARAVVGLDVLARIGTDVALMHLHGIAQKLKFKGLQEKAREKIDEIAQARGLTAEELGDRLVPDLGLDDDGSLRLDFGPRAFRVRFDETLKPLVEGDDGKRLPDLPKAKASDDAEKAKAATETWKALKKDAKTIAQAQLLRLELAMCAERRWDEDVFRPFLLEHPLLIHLVRRVIWGAFDPKSGALRSTFRVAEDSSLADTKDAPYTLPDGSKIGLVHRLHLDDATAAAWGQVLSDYELIQPFEQLSRGVVRPSAEEARAEALDRVKGLKVPTGKVLGLDARGWRRGPPQDAGVVCWYEKPLGDVIVAMDLDPGIFTGMISESPEQTLGVVTLTSDGYRKIEKKTFGELSPLVFSELMRDLDSLRA